MNVTAISMKESEETFSVTYIPYPALNALYYGGVELSEYLYTHNRILPATP
jgi:hypothetical protein